MAAKTDTPEQATTPTTAIARFQLPAPVDAGTPENNVKGEALVNSVIVLRGVGSRIDAQLGPCRPVFFQFPADFENVGPIPGNVSRDAHGEQYLIFPDCVSDGSHDGVYQFLLSESSPALRVAREMVSATNPGQSARLATMRAQRSKANAGFSYYVMDRPQNGDIYADRDSVIASSLP